MKASCRHAILAVTLLMLAACVSVPAPTYQPSVDLSQALLEPGYTGMAVGEFTAGDGVENASLGMRGSRLKGGSDGTYSGYLREALITELTAAGHHDARSGIRISGTLTRNELDAAGVKVGKAALGARFVVTRDGNVVYDKDLETEHEWQSSFMGAVAIPAAISNYSIAVQKLLSAFLEDPDFLAAIEAK